MEEQGGNDNLLHFMSMNFDGKANEVSHLPEDVPAQHLVFADGKSGEQINALPLPHEWIQTPKFSHNYVEYLAESSTFLPKATTEDMLESVPSNVGGIRAVVGGVSEIQSGISYNNNLGKAPASKPADSFYGMDASKFRFLGPHDEGEPVNKSTIPQYHIHAESSRKNHSSWTQDLIGANSNVSQLDPGVTIAEPGFLSRARPRASRKRSLATDRDRRVRIGERVNALRELLPQSGQGDQPSVLVDIIDYIKYLQLQIKELSQSRLVGESSTAPFIFLEGYGHFISQQMQNEPLEEMMAKLLEENPLAAAKLLQSKGLYSMPIDVAQGLRQAP
ncbi:hypothetical protein FH972_006117 [Carpinus fangiana]|uniref:BHLH domain-containing protein n=1 Tax=Carpinus fangiana TaxID=176857 RepID=A0A5N6QRM2_9ROSI|nr:hypothetical protein FH972_006117 [Carpinus fangiana]